MHHKVSRDNSQKSEHLQPLPVSPTLAEEATDIPSGAGTGVISGRTFAISGLAVLVAVAATITAKLLVMLIDFVTNLAFHGSASLTPSSPASNTLGPWVVVVPVVGGLIVGVMARYGSSAIRGHGIPEAMEQVLTNQSRIPPRITLLKPTSSAIAIGTGGPFGAEGPIIATGGAFGSLVGQLLRTTAIERKILLASGAAAGMTAIFGSPIAAVILAIELLLFELRPNSLIPVALACASAAGLRRLFFEGGFTFAMPNVRPAGEGALLFYVGLGVVMGLAAVVVTDLVYRIEDWFEKLPIHWMLWPALGGLVVGVIGYFAPRSLGVGYSNITDVLKGSPTVGFLLVLCAAKFVSWSIALGSGTSGGTLAPLLTIGGCLGAAVGSGASHLIPGAGIDPRIAGLVGMAALFGGASRALLTSIVFALETTGQPAALAPLLGGCTAAYAVSCLLMKNTIMTEKIVRRGIRVPNEYVADYLSHVQVGQACKKPVVTLRQGEPLGQVRAWLKGHSPQSEHQGFPVLSETGALVGVVTRRDLLDPAVADDQKVSEVIRREPVTIHPEASLRDAADKMVRSGTGRLPIVELATGALVGIVTRSDLLGAHTPRLREHEHRERTIKLRQMVRSRLRLRKVAKLSK